MNGKHYIGKRVSSFEAYDNVGPITGVALVVDEENEYIAGDINGYVLELECPYGTQQIANQALASVQGKIYKGFRATNAVLNPLAEIGDGVTVNGLYSMLAYRSVNLGPGHMSEIAAPGENELNHEYPYVSSTQREINRKIASTRSQIKKTAEEILLQVEATDGRVTSLSVSLDGVVSKVQGLEGSYSSLEQYVDSITLSVNNGSTSSTISLKAGGVEIASQTISMSGLVTFSGLAGGTTTIDGACIKTGTIDANRLNLSGAITFSDLSASVQNDINDAYSMATDAQNVASNVDGVVSGWTYRGTTYIDGGVLMTDTVRASTLEGGRVRLLTADEDIAGTLRLTGASSSDFAVDLTSNGALRLVAADGNAYLQDSRGAFVQCGDGMETFGQDIGPAGSGNISCGTSGHKWSSVYAVSGTIQTSDRTKKHDISYDLSKYDALFDMLAPATFKLNDGSSGRTHVGLISQDIETSLEIAGLSSLEFGGFIKTPRLDADGNVTGYDYALRYDEFVPLCIRRIKALEERINRLEEQRGN